MPLKKIARIVNVANVGVPVSLEGNYLDWRHIDGDHAETLHSPFGPRHFVLGDDRARVVLDFGVLPNGWYVLTAAPEPTTLDLHPEDFQNVHPPREVADAAYHLVLHAIECLERAGVVCENPWSYMRAVCEHAGVNL